MKFFKRLKFILNIRRFIPFLYEFFRSKEVTLKQKLISISLVFVYWLFPFDLVPDFFAMFGILDDLTILTLILSHMVKIAPPELRQKYMF